MKLLPVTFPFLLPAADQSYGAPNVETFTRGVGVKEHNDGESVVVTDTLHQHQQTRNIATSQRCRSRNFIVDRNAFVTFLCDYLRYISNSHE